MISPRRPRLSCADGKPGVVAVVFGLLGLYARHQDRRLLRDAVLLVAAIWFALWGVATLDATVSRPSGLVVIPCSR